MSTQIKKKNPNIILTVLGKGVSRLGSQLYGFAMSFYILFVTGSSQSFAISLLLTTIPSIIMGPIAGHFADLKSKKALVVGADVLSGLLMLVVYVWTLSHGLSLWIIYLCTFLLAVLSTVLGTTLQSALPSLVDKEDLLKINTSLQGVDAVVMFASPLLGGFLYKLISPELFLLLNGISFLFSAVSELFINFHYNNEQLVSENNNSESQIASEEKENNGFFAKFKESLAYLNTRQYLKSLIVYLAFINFFAPAFIIVMPYIAVTIHKMGPETLGIIQMIFPIGMVLGNVVIQKLKTRFSTKLLVRGVGELALSFLLFSVPTLPFVRFPNKLLLPYYGAVMFFLSFSLIKINVTLGVFFQEEIDKSYRGRVMGLMGSVTQAMMPLSYLIVGVLLDYIPGYYIMCICALCNFLLCARILTCKVMNEHDTAI